MAVKFQNFEYSYLKNGKRIFVQTALGKQIGKEVKSAVEDCYAFDPIYYHLGNGGHVGALHEHRKNSFFARTDLENFFYTVARNRVARCLSELGIRRPVHFAKWSTVKSVSGEGYFLPYGFVQSPILASLVLSMSAVGSCLLEISRSACVSVYVDDIAISSNDKLALGEMFAHLKAAISQAGFTIKHEKTQDVAERIELFNCSLENQNTAVTDVRKQKFLTSNPTETKLALFDAYCDRVADGSLQR